MGIFNSNFFKKNSLDFLKSKSNELVDYFEKQQNWQENLISSFKFEDMENHLEIFRFLLQKNIINLDFINFIKYEEDLNKNELSLLLHITVNFYFKKEMIIEKSFGNYIFSNKPYSESFKKHLCKILLKKEDFNAFKNYSIKDDLIILDSEFIIESISEWIKNKPSEFVEKIKNILSKSEINNLEVFTFLCEKNLIVYFDTINVFNFLKNNSKTISCKVEYDEKNINTLMILFYQEKLFEFNGISIVYNYLVKTIEDKKNFPFPLFSYFKNYLSKNLNDSNFFNSWKKRAKKIDLTKNTFFLFSPFFEANLSDISKLEDLQFILNNLDVFNVDKNLLFQKYLQESILKFSSEKLDEHLYPKISSFLDLSLIELVNKLNINLKTYNCNSNFDLKNIELGKNKNGKYIPYTFTAEYLRKIFTTDNYENIIVGKFLQERSVFKFLSKYESQVNIDDIEIKINDLMNESALLTANLADKAINADVCDNGYLLEFKKDVEQFKTEISSKNLIFSINLSHKFLGKILLGFYDKNKKEFTDANLSCLNKICAKFNKIILSYDNSFNLYDFYNNPICDSNIINIKNIINSGRHYIITANYSNNNERYIYHDYFYYFLNDCIDQNVLLNTTRNTQELNDNLINKIDKNIDFFDYLSDLSKLNFFFDLDKNTIVSGTPDVDKSLLDFLDKIFSNDNAGKGQTQFEKQEQKNQPDLTNEPNSNVTIKLNKTQKLTGPTI